MDKKKNKNSIGAEHLRTCTCSGRPVFIDNHGIEWVRSNRFTVKAIDRKRQRDIWKEGTIWVSRDGGIYYSIRAYNQWAANQNPQASRNAEAASASASLGRPVKPPSRGASTAHPE